jgi:hypothetical protein
MYLMASAVAGSRETYTVFIGNGLNILMVIGVLKSGLESIMINIGYR